MVRESMNGKLALQESKHIRTTGERAGAGRAASRFVRDVNTNETYEGRTIWDERYIDDADRAAKRSRRPDLPAAVGPAGRKQDADTPTGPAGGLTGV
jgi:hypothetical protein